MRCAESLLPGSGMALLGGETTRNGDWRVFMKPDGPPRSGVLGLVGDGRGGVDIGEPGCGVPSSSGVRPGESGWPSFHVAVKMAVAWSHGSPLLAWTVALPETPGVVGSSPYWQEPSRPGVGLMPARRRSSLQRSYRSLALRETSSSFLVKGMPCSLANFLAPLATSMLGGTCRRNRGWLLFSSINLARLMGFLITAYDVSCI